MAKVRVLTFSGEDGSFLREWPYVGDDLQIGWDLLQPAAASMTAAWGEDWCSAGHLTPGGVPAIVEIDATGAGVPEVWLGRFGGIDVASGRGPRGLTFEGPSSWLDSEDAVVRNGETIQGSPGSVVQGILAAYPLDLRLDIGADVYHGPGLPVQLAGQSVLGLMTGLAQATGEEPRLAAKPGAGRLEWSWLSPFAPLDQSPVVSITEGRHVEWSYTGAVQTRTELAMAGRSFDAGNRVRSVAVRSVDGRVLGRRAALTAILEEWGPRDDPAQKDGSGAITDPLEAAGAMLRSMVSAELRRWITPRYPIVITVTERSLWPFMRRGALVRVQFPSDDFGVYQDAVVRIQTVGFQLGGAQVCEIGAELWESSASYG